MEQLLQKIQQNHDKQTSEGLAQAVVLMKEACELAPPGKLHSLLISFGEALESSTHHRADALQFLNWAYSLDPSRVPWKTKCKLVFLRRVHGHIDSSIELGLITVASFKEEFANVVKPPQSMQRQYVKLLSRLSRDLIAVQNVSGAAETIHHALGLTGQQHIFVLLNAMVTDMQGNTVEASRIFEQAAKLASKEKIREPTVMAVRSDQLMGIGASGNFARDLFTKRPVAPVVHDEAPPPWIDDTTAQITVDTDNTLSPSALHCQLDRRHNIPLAEFMVEYASAGKPVVLTGLMDEW
jgi:hypothetical protein